MLALALLLTVACTAERSLFAPEADPAGSGAPFRDPALVGTWQVTLLVDAGGDLQTWTTRWRFAADGSCEFTRTIRSVLEGLDRITARPCRWTTANARVTVVYTADGSAAQLPYAFAALDPDRLVLEGVEYARSGER